LIYDYYNDLNSIRKNNSGFFNYFKKRTKRKESFETAKNVLNNLGFSEEFKQFQKIIQSKYTKEFYVIFGKSIDQTKSRSKVDKYFKNRTKRLHAILKKVIILK